MEERDNRFYIGNLLGGIGISDFARAHKKLTQVIVTLIVLTIILEIYGSIMSTANFFGSEATTFNPLKIFFSLGQAPFIGMVILVLSFFIGLFITRLITKDVEKRYEENVRGESIDNLGPYGRGKIADKEELKKVYDFLPDTKGIEGTIVCRWPETDEILVKPWAEHLSDYVHQLKNDHVLVAAPSSAGKTWNMILPNLISHMLSGHSLICVDPKGELFTDIGPLCRLLGYKVRILNLSPSEMKNSDGYDILKSIRDAADPESMADDICASILRNVGTGKQDFWNNANTNLLSLVLLYVSHARNFIPITSPMKRDSDGNVIVPGDEQRTFKEVAAYIEDPSALKANIENAIGKDPTGDGVLLGGRFRTWASNKEAAQIASGLSTSLSIFRNKSIAETLSHDDMSIDMLANEKSIYFVVIDPMNDSFRPVTSVYFTTVFSELIRIAKTKDTNRLDRMVYLILEETPTLGLIPKLPTALDVIRGHNVGIMLCVQELAKLEELYGPQTTLNMIGNCLIQVCMGANVNSGSLATLTNANYFSAISGVQTLYDTITSEERNKYIPESIQEMTVLAQRQMARSSRQEVFLPDDILRIKGNEIFVKSAMHNAFIGKRFSWKDHPLSDIVIRNKLTGEIAKMKTGDHIPHYLSGTDDIFDPEMYETVNLRDERGFRPVRQKETSGVRYDKFLK